MSAPVIFYMFLNAFAPIVINDNFLTTIVFDEEIVRPHSGATLSELYLKKSPDSKMLFIKSKGKHLVTNLNVPTKSGNLYTFLIRTGENPNSIIHIKVGKNDSLYKDVKRLGKVLIQESRYTAKVINNSKHSVLVNSVEVGSGNSRKLPKGAPVFINNKRILR